METHYTGSADLGELIAEGIRSGEVVLPTDLGEIRFRVIGTDANIVSGTTTDHKLVTVDLSPPHLVRIS